jgi:hypothetical protein
MPLDRIELLLCTSECIFPASVMLDQEYAGAIGCSAIVTWLGPATLPDGRTYHVNH